MSGYKWFIILIFFLRWELAALRPSRSRTTPYRPPGCSRGKATSWTARSDPGWRRGGDFSPLLRVQTGPGVHSTSCKMNTEAFPGVKRPNVELVTSPLPNAEVANIWTLASTSPWAFVICNGDSLSYFYLYPQYKTRLGEKFGKIRYPQVTV